MRKKKYIAKKINSMNIFFEYKNLKPDHENRLTKAYLSLINISPSLLKKFTELVYSNISNEDFKYQQFENHPIISTQKGSLPVTKRYISVYISDDKVEREIEVAGTDRTPVYDGIIQLDDALTIFIENKPVNKSIYDVQLSPDIDHLPEESTLYKHAVGLSWRKIVDGLLNTLSEYSTQHYEKIIIRDFLDYLNVYYSWLNPYDALEKCQHSVALVKNRLEVIATALVGEKEETQYINGWGNAYTLNRKSIKKIGLILEYDVDGNDWNKLVISAHFGLTKSQASHFYDNNLIDDFKDLKSWKLHSSIHFYYSQTSVLDIFDSDMDRILRYYDYFKSNYYNSSNSNGIKQLKSYEIQEWLNDLDNKGLIDFTDQNKLNVRRKIEDKNYTVMNVTPGY